MRRRLERRADDFLALVRRTVYQHDPSPYRLLLRLAGCEFGDLEKLVTGEGLEGALRTLYRQGVYLTVDEYKGRRPAVRGSTTVAFEPQQLSNPLVASHIVQHTSGSRGRATPVVVRPRVRPGADRRSDALLRRPRRWAVAPRDLGAPRGRLDPPDARFHGPGRSRQALVLADRSGQRRTPARIGDGSAPSCGSGARWRERSRPDRGSCRSTRRCRSSTGWPTRSDPATPPTSWPRRRAPRSGCARPRTRRGSSCAARTSRSPGSR